MKIFEAIATQRAITSRYNRGEVLLAPHILYTKNDALHIDAITLERDGQPPREPKLGTFKLDGLKDIELSERPFAISELFDANDAKYVDVTLFKVEAEPVAG
ncbi:MAG: hypothetical protein LKF30_11600 [Sphingobium sp.]|nr:hypothetical protein [Sphingobium sp.]MCI1270511.1 hypothetical protein [Sphingobium sp.]MCI1756495.1 hypothetical protein [Sphingobium sp.]MCI2051805.1 hypothetical protein [Sphingobium sp.]